MSRRPGRHAVRWPDGSMPMETASAVRISPCYDGAVSGVCGPGRFSHISKTMPSIVHAFPADMDLTSHGEDHSSVPARNLLFRTAQPVQRPRVPTTRVPSGIFFLAGCCSAGYCVAVRPSLNGPRPTAHEYLSFPLPLRSANERVWLCIVGWFGAYLIWDRRAAVPLVPVGVTYREGTESSKGQGLPGQYFTEYFLRDGIEETAEWRELMPSSRKFDSFRDEVRRRYYAIVRSDSPNEAVTEQEIIRPVLEALGWSDYLPQQGSSGNEDIPDHLLFTDAESKERAGAKSRREGALPGRAGCGGE